MDKKERVRPYWHIDAKWICGILFSQFLFVSLFLFVISTLTSEKVAVPVATYIVASQYSRNGLDDPTEIEEFKEKNAASGEEVIRPLPGQDVTISRDELATLSPRELRLRIFQQVVEPIYKQKRTDESLKRLGPLSFLNYETHLFLNRIFLLSLIPLLLTAAGLVGFSYRYGRLISPAIPLILVSAPFSFMLFFIQNSNPPAGNSGPFSSLPRELVIEVIASLSPIFYGVYLTGLGLMVAAIILKLISRFKKNTT